MAQTGKMASRERVLASVRHQEPDRVPVDLGATFFDQTYLPYLDGYPENYRDLPNEMPKIHWAGLAHS